MNEEEREEAEWALSQILLNPVLFREFINDGNPDIEPMEIHERMWSACTADRISLCCGRAVHKTTTMIEMLYWWVITKNFSSNDQPSLLLMVPNKAQKDLSFGRIAAACRTHWLISMLVDRNSINISEGRINFYNGFVMGMRIAGSGGTEANVIGIHTNRIWVDEAQEFPWNTWQSLQNCLNWQTDTHQMFVSGVPNGERKDNVLYRCDQEDDHYIAFNVPQTAMSWWTPEIEYTRKKQYYSIQEESEDYKHFVLGLHGVPTFSIFDRVRFKKENYELHRFVITQEMANRVKRTTMITDQEGNLVEQIIYDMENLILYPPVPAEFGFLPKIGLGYDVGYSPDPAVFFVMYEDYKTGVYKQLARYVLQRVEYAVQRELLLYLDTAYQLSFIGMDMGGPGKVVYQELTGELIEARIKAHNFAERLYPVEFGGQMVVAAHNENGELIEKKDQVKRIAVETLSRWVQETPKFTFAEDDDNLMAELERTKFQRNNVGDPIYKTADDHQMAAMMCAIMAYEHRFGTPLGLPSAQPSPKLMKAKWLNVGAY